MVELVLIAPWLPQCCCGGGGRMRGATRVGPNGDAINRLLPPNKGTQPSLYDTPLNPKP